MSGLRKLGRQHRLALVDSQRGFTLIEMMLAIGVLGLILAMLSTSFHTVASSRLDAEQHLLSEHQGRALLWQMSSELRGAVQTTDEPSHVFLSGVASTSGGSPMDSISVSTLDVSRHRSMTGFGAEDLVTYYPVPNPRRPGWYLLQRSEQSALINGNSPSQNMTVLADNLIAMHLRYFNGQIWSESWDSAALEEGQQLPVAIMIELVLAAPTGRAMTFSTEVALPMAVQQW